MPLQRWCGKTQTRRRRGGIPQAASTFAALSGHSDRVGRCSVACLAGQTPRTRRHFLAIGIRPGRNVQFRVEYAGTRQHARRASPALVNTGARPLARAATAVSHEPELPSLSRQSRRGLQRMCVHEVIASVAGLPCGALVRQVRDSAAEDCDSQVRPRTLRETTCDRRPRLPPVVCNGLALDHALARRRNVGATRTRLSCAVHPARQQPRGVAFAHVESKGDRGF